MATTASKISPQKNFLIPTILIQAFCLLMVAPLVSTLLFNNVTGHLIHESGEVSERLIIFTLLCTPLFILFGWTLPIRYRRTLGVYSFVALAVHVFARLSTHGYTFETLFQNASITIGTLAFGIMIALTATSLDSIKQAMGRAWKRLHYGVYAVAIMTEIHVLILDYPNLHPHGIIFGIFMILILAIRLPFIRSRLQARWQKRND